MSVLDQWPDEVLGHPRHLAAQPVLADLIQQLRDCANVKDGYELQQALLGHLNAADTARGAFAQAVKRMRRGESPQRGAPDPQSGAGSLAPGNLAAGAGRLRAGRPPAQMRRRRSGMARVRIPAQAHHRPVPECAARRIRRQGGQGSRTRARRAGLPRGRQVRDPARPDQLPADRRRDHLRQRRHLHDHRGQDQSRRTSPAQNRKVKAAAAAVDHNAPLPGDDRRARMYDPDLPYHVRLDVLRLGTERAARDGIFTAKLPGARALLVTDIYGYAADGWTGDEWPDLPAVQPLPATCPAARPRRADRRGERRPQPGLPARPPAPRHAPPAARPGFSPCGVWVPAPDLVVCRF